MARLHCALAILLILAGFMGSARPALAQGCLPNQVECNGTCFDPMTSPLHCGACNARCFSDESCIAGTCILVDSDGDQWSNQIENQFVCDPNNANINPGAAERCNTIDDDCDGQIDEPLPHSLCPAEVNSLCVSRACTSAGCGNVFATIGTPCGSGTSFCDGNGTCMLAIGGVPLDLDADGDQVNPPLDCDDGFAAIRPGLTEICDGYDNDCDGGRDNRVDCDDGNVCTTDSCLGRPGCRNRARFDGTPCGTNSICQSAQCVSIDVFKNGFEAPL